MAVAFTICSFVPDNEAPRPPGEGDAIQLGDGWPEGVDGEAYVLRYLETGSRRAALLKEVAALEI